MYNLDSDAPTLAERRRNLFITLAKNSVDSDFRKQAYKIAEERAKLNLEPNKNDVSNFAKKDCHK